MPPQSRSARAQAPAGQAPRGRHANFVLYVEGPRDRDILHTWARRSSVDLAPVVGAAVILGGRQPQRAVEHFRGVRAAEPAARGLCVLDRDDAAPGAQSEAWLDEPGLAFFTWSRRHIESYLLVPEAVRRTVHGQKERFRLERFLREHLPERGDEAAWRSMDAKRLLEREGPLARALGQPLAGGHIARAMRADELHADVVALLSRIRAGLASAEADRRTGN
jgi:hypothetical protein